jgi:hypothetical protein
MNKHEAAVAAGEEAQRILNSPVFSQAFDDVRAALVRQWEETPTDQASRETCIDIHRRLKCLADIRKALDYRVKTGQMAQKELTAREKAVNMLKRPFAKR